MTVDPIPPDDRNFVTALARGLEVMLACGSHEGGLSLAQLAQRTGLSRATVRRFLLTLHALGYVTFDDRLYSLAPKVLALGGAFLSSMPLPRIVRPFLLNISQQLKESCSVAILDGSEIVYVAREQAGRIMSVDLGIGSRLPAAATSMGRVLLSALPAADRLARLQGGLPAFTDRTVTAPEKLLDILDGVACQGYCIVDQELEAGLRSIAVPLVDAQGRTVAGLNIGTQAARVPEDVLIATYLPLLRQTAAAIRPLLLG